MKAERAKRKRGMELLRSWSLRLSTTAGKTEERPLAVVPAFSVMLEPGTQVISTHNGSTTTVTVGVTRNVLGTESSASESCIWNCRLVGDRSRSSLQWNLRRRGENRDLKFKVIPAALRQGRATVRAVLKWGGEKYAEGYTLVTREDLGQLLLLSAGAAAREYCRCAGAA